MIPTVISQWNGQNVSDPSYWVCKRDLSFWLYRICIHFSCKDNYLKQIWPPGGSPWIGCKCGHQVAPLALPNCLGMLYWQHQPVLSCNLHQPESHKFNLKKKWVTSQLIDRTPGIHGSNKELVRGFRTNWSLGQIYKLSNAKLARLPDLPKFCQFILSNNLLFTALYEVKHHHRRNVTSHHSFSSWNCWHGWHCWQFWQYWHRFFRQSDTT